MVYWGTHPYWGTQTAQPVIVYEKHPYLVYYRTNKGKLGCYHSSSEYDIPTTIESVREALFDAKVLHKEPLLCLIQGGKA